MTEPTCARCGSTDPDPDYGVHWSYALGCWICGECLGVEEVPS